MFLQCNIASFTHNSRDVDPQRTDVVAVHNSSSSARELNVGAVHLVHLQVLHRIDSLVFGGVSQL